MTETTTPSASDDWSDDIHLDDEQDSTTEGNPLSLTNLGVDPKLAEWLPDDISRRRKVPLALMHALVTKGLTNKQIRQVVLDLYGNEITSSAVHAFRRAHGYETRQPTEHAMKLIPWKIAQEHSGNQIYHYLVFEARLRAGQALSYRERVVRDAMIRRIAMTGDGSGVIHYDRTNGFRLVPARDGIDTDLIREPGIDDSGNPIVGWKPRQ